MTAYITHYGTTVQPGTYVEYRIDGLNVHGILPMGTTAEDAQKRVDAANAQYGKYGHVHTLTARVIHVGAWDAAIVGAN